MAPVVRAIGRHVRPGPQSFAATHSEPRQRLAGGRDGSDIRVKMHSAPSAQSLSRWQRGGQRSAPFAATHSEPQIVSHSSGLSTGSPPVWDSVDDASDCVAVANALALGTGQLCLGSRPALDVGGIVGCARGARLARARQRTKATRIASAANAICFPACMKDFRGTIGVSTERTARAS